jgi:hypothetical protein
MARLVVSSAMVNRSRGKSQHLLNIGLFWEIAETIDFWVIDSESVGSIPTALTKPTIHAGFREFDISRRNKSRNNAAAAASRFVAPTSVRRSLNNRLKG